MNTKCPDATHINTTQQLLELKDKGIAQVEVLAEAKTVDDFCQLLAEWRSLGFLTKPLAKPDVRLVRVTLNTTRMADPDLVLPSYNT